MEYSCCFSNFAMLVHVSPKKMCLWRYSAYHLKTHRIRNNMVPKLPAQRQAETIWYQNYLHRGKKKQYGTKITCTEARRNNMVPKLPVQRQEETIWYQNYLHRGKKKQYGTKITCTVARRNNMVPKLPAQRQEETIWYQNYLHRGEKKKCKGFGGCFVVLTSSP